MNADRALAVSFAGDEPMEIDASVHPPTRAGEQDNLGGDAVEFADLEARFTAEDPRYPARNAASKALQKYVNKWFDSYELDDGESQPHAPSEFESLLIMDAFHGLTGDEEYMALQAAWFALCGPERTTSPQASEVPASRSVWTSEPNSTSSEFSALRADRDRLRGALERIIQSTHSHVNGRDLLAELHPRNILDIKRRVDARETWFQGDWLSNLWTEVKSGRAALLSSKEPK